MANYREPQWLLPNEKNLAMPASDATVGSGLAEDRHSLYSTQFDGVNNFVQLLDGTLYAADNPFIPVNNRYSISAWIKITGGSNERTIYALSLNGSGEQLTFRINASNNLEVRIRDLAGSPYYTTITGSATLSNDVWYHVAMTWDSANIQLYVNGSTDGSPVASTTFIYTGSFTWWASIGAAKWRANPPDRDFVGEIDEVAIWSDRGLTASEISTLYNSGSPSNPMLLSAKPEFYYPLGEQARLGSQWQFPNEVLQSQVINFDGTDEIEIPETTLSDEFSISVWLNSNTFTAGQAMLFGGDSSNAYKIEFNGPTIINLKIAGSNTGLSGSAWDLNEWQHLLITRNSSNLVTIYRNGVSWSTVTKAGDFIFDRISGFYNSAAHFDGELSNIAIWNSDQTANKDNIYNNGAPQTSYTVTPTAWYKLNATSEYAGLNPNFHNALDFSGTDYIDCGTGLGTTLGAANENLTFSMWFNINSAPNNDGLLTLSSGSSAGNTGALSVQIQNSTNINIYWDSSAATLTYATPSLNTWHNLTVVKNGTTVTTYIDGAVSTPTATAGAVPSSIDFSGLSTLLGLYWNTSYTFNGKLSNVAFFNQAISAEDVLYLYNGGTPQTSLSFEPLSWWKLDNLTTGIQDSGSASNNGTNNGATEVSSSVAVDQWNFDNAVQSQTPNWSSTLDFNGSSGYIDLDPGVMKTFTSDNLSISCWLKADALGTYNYVYADGHTSGNKVVSLSYASVRGGLEFSVGNSTVARASGVAINTGEWYHVVCTYAAGGDLKFYLNGNTTPVATATFSGALDLAGHTVSAIGRSNIHSSYYWDGEISNVQVWNTELGTSDVTTLYNSGQPQSTASLSPKSWYKLDNTTTGIQDSGSAGVNGTNNGATETQTNVWTPRLNGESTTLPSTALVSSDLQFESPYSNFSLEFDGTDDIIQVPRNTVLEPANITISCWVNVDATGSHANGYFVSKIHTSGASVSYGIYKPATPTFVINVGGVIKYSPAYGTDIQGQGWHHLLGTYDGSHIRLYVNGTEVGTGTAETGSISYTTEDAYIGSFEPASLEIKGKIDETAIWNTALTQAQVSQVYNNGYPADLTSLSPVSWWRLGEDAYFVSPNFTLPNKITGAPNGTSQNMDQADLVADAPGSYASGIGSSLVLADRVGDAPESTANSLSFNMTPLNKISYPSGYVPTQADNVYSMAFDGTSDYVSIGSIDVTGTVSVSFWFNAGVSSNNGGIFTMASDATNCISIALWQSNVQVYAGSSITRARSTDTISTSTWYHVVVVKSASAIDNIYINGVDKTLDATGFWNGSIDTPQAEIGKGAFSGTDYNFNGNIDEVAIFDYALSARQIKQDIYNGTTTGKTADLNNISNLTAPVAWYRMGD